MKWYVINVFACEKGTYAIDSVDRDGKGRNDLLTFVRQC